MKMEEEKSSMIDIEWANNYTDYLEGNSEIVNRIDNKNLKLKTENPDLVLIEDEDYVNILINNDLFLGSGE
jgi:hypothetical protein